MNNPTSMADMLSWFDPSLAVPHDYPWLRLCSPVSGLDLPVGLVDDAHVRAFAAHNHLVSEAMAERAKGKTLQ
ncbi:hypothetical protein LZV00_01855 [Pseudomonas kielensis]|uniref:hypothetical protein n=1 Tax=Pseudomonas kielensis TaxID=2762577 RepID=UPI00223FBCC2|nr:hypothetical protein [Pseudomonas kielensis]UZM14587.1 hypothetical protein LZV00_01855 [Pseudomonas kielensis]